MNIKALITTLVLGSSSAALADTTFSASAHASWSLGSPVSTQVHRDYDRDRTSTWTVDYRRSDTVARDRIRRPAYPQPVYLDSCAEPHNSTVGANSSEYKGRIYSMPVNRNWYQRPSWFSLTDATRIDSGRQFITIGAQAGRFDQLLLQQVAGTSYIKQVLVRFANGEEMVVRGINEQLNRNNQNVVIDLKGQNRQIGSIVVYGETSARSAYKVMGR
ncbi:MAG: hypothetical protein AB7O24_05685 [Kofleriaceae bacterium]